MAEFKNEITFNTDDINSYINEVFKIKPELEFYYGGYSSSSLGNIHSVKFKYNNTEINPENIKIAKSYDDVLDIISYNILYCNENLYLICDKSYEIEKIIDEVIKGNQIVAMGYSGFKSSSFNSNITNNSCHIINFQYSIDTSLLIQYKKETEYRAMEILSERTAKSMPDYVKAKIIHDYIAEYTDYNSDDGELSYMAYNVLINNRGVCSGYACSAKIMFDLLGIENYYVSGTATNSKGTDNHGWNKIKLGDNFYNLDITWDDPVVEFGFNTTKYDYFNLTDDELSKDHNWDNNNLPISNSYEYSYKNVIKLIMSDRSKYDDYYNISDFKSVFTKYDNIFNDNLNSTEVTTEIITYKEIRNDKSIIEAFNSFPFKTKVLCGIMFIFIIILIIVFIF
ncbi:MAG: transglutaminase domain-containing protein [Lachnospirales bacterium]